MELKAFTTMLTQLGDLRVACGPMEINRPSRIQSMTHNHSRLLMPVAPLRHRPVSGRTCGEIPQWLPLWQATQGIPVPMQYCNTGTSLEQGTLSRLKEYLAIDRVSRKSRRALSS